MSQNRNQTGGRPAARSTNQSSRQPVQHPAARANAAGRSGQPVQRPTGKAQPTQRYRNGSAPSGGRAPGRNGRMSKEKWLLIGGAIVIAVIAIVLIAVFAGPRAKQPAAEANTPEPTLAPVVSATPEMTLAPTLQPTAEPVNDVADPARAAYRPAASSNLLPIFRKAKTSEKIIAITVDDCYQADNLEAIVQCALDSGAKLTIFPIGKVALKTPHRDILRYAWENGMELENHTYSHHGLFDATDEEMSKQMYLQNLALSEILGVEYQCHFIRPKGGDARADERIHAYARQLGYKGVAHWNISGSGATQEQLKESLAPGNIYLFHTTDNKDLDKLLWFIPYAVSQGYELVTLNDMFGYPENETAPLETAIEDHVMPTLAPYDSVTIALKKGKYDSRVRKLQLALIEMGYLEGEADGSYGDGTVEAVKKFQTASGVKPNGEASVAMQEYLYAYLAGNATPVPGANYTKPAVTTAPQ